MPAARIVQGQVLDDVEVGDVHRGEPRHERLDRGARVLRRDATPAPAHHRQTRNYTAADGEVAGFSEASERGLDDADDGLPAERLEAVNRALRRATAHEIAQLERYLPFLATTASATPFIGLFGTVWGVIAAFHGIGPQGSPTPPPLPPPTPHPLL